MGAGAIEIQGVYEVYLRLIKYLNECEYSSTAPRSPLIEGAALSVCFASSFLVCGLGHLGVS